MVDAILALVDRVDRLAEAVYTLAAVVLAIRERLPADQAAKHIAQQRHEIRHALANWRPPRDSYRAIDLTE
jgi:uncharacterized protein (DUF2267 family)